MTPMNALLSLLRAGFNKKKKKKKKKGANPEESNQPIYEFYQSDIKQTSLVTMEQLQSKRKRPQNES